MIVSTLLLILGLILGAVLAVAVVIRRATGPKPETHLEPCRNCNPESESDRYYCIICRPEIGFDYPPERY